MTQSDLYASVLEFNRTLLTALEQGDGQRVLRQKLAEGALMLGDQVVMMLGGSEGDAGKQALIEVLLRSLRLKLLLARDLGVLTPNAFKDLGETLDRLRKALKAA